MHIMFVGQYNQGSEKKILEQPVQFAYVEKKNSVCTCLIAEKKVVAASSRKIRCGRGAANYLPSLKGKLLSYVITWIIAARQASRPASVV